MHKLIRQFLQYVVVGGFAFLVDFGTLYGLTEFVGMHYLLSATIGFLLGLSVNYAICVVWIFDFRRITDRRHEFLVFGVIGIVGLGLNNALLYSFTEWAGIPYLVSKLLAAAIILFFNFSLRKVILFTERSPINNANP